MTETLSPAGSEAESIIRKARCVSKRNSVIIIGIPWQILTLAEIEDGEGFKMYIDFPNKDKIGLEKVVPEKG